MTWPVVRPDEATRVAWKVRVATAPGARPAPSGHRGEGTDGDQVMAFPTAEAVPWAVVMLDTPVSWAGTVSVTVGA